MVEIRNYLHKKIVKLDARIDDSDKGILRFFKANPDKRRAANLTFLGMGILIGSGELSSDEARGLIDSLAGEEPREQTEFSAQLINEHELADLAILNSYFERSHAPFI